MPFPINSENPLSAQPPASFEIQPEIAEDIASKPESIRFEVALLSAQTYPEATAQNIEKFILSSDDLIRIASFLLDNHPAIFLFYRSNFNMPLEQTDLLQMKLSEVENRYTQYRENLTLSSEGEPTLKKIKTLMELSSLFHNDPSNSLLREKKERSFEKIADLINRYLNPALENDPLPLLKLIKLYPQPDSPLFLKHVFTQLPQGKALNSPAALQHLVGEFAYELITKKVDCIDIEKPVSPLHLDEKIIAFLTDKDSAKRKAFLVQAPVHSGLHISLVIVEKGEKISLFLVDSLGFDSKNGRYVKNIIGSLFGMENGLKDSINQVYVYEPKRQQDENSCPLIVLSDLLAIAKNPHLFEQLGSLPKKEATIYETSIFLVEHVIGFIQITQSVDALRKRILAHDELIPGVDRLLPKFETMHLSKFLKENLIIGPKGKVQNSYLMKAQLKVLVSLYKIAVEKSGGFVLHKGGIKRYRETQSILEGDSKRQAFAMLTEKAANDV